MERGIIAFAVAGMVAAGLGQVENSNFYLPQEELEPVVRQEGNLKKEAMTVESDPAALQLRERETAPVREVTNAPDPFGLAKAFEVRWDFSFFLMSAQEELSFRMDAARARTLRLARAFSSLASEVEIRQRNLGAAAMAAYLLSRDQATFHPVGGRNLSDAPMVAVRATMQQDMAAMEGALVNYETLRGALNASADHVVRLEKQGLAASPYNALAGEDRPTLPHNLVARAQTVAVLQERMFEADVLKAILNSEDLRVTGESRQSIASFAPPPPVDLEPPSPYNFTDRDPAATVSVDGASGASLKRPEQTASVFPVPVNAAVHAAREGVVVYSGPLRGHGLVVIIEHDKDVFSVSSHLAAVNVDERESVEKGQLIGRAGSVPELGQPGVHFQVRRGRDPVLPGEWLQGHDVRQALLRE